MAAETFLGSKFAKLTVVSFAGRDPWNGSKWLCRCDCGGTIVVRRTALNSGNTKSCGCIRFPDIAGRQFGRLTAIKLTASQPRAKWLFQCECGNRVVARRDHVASGATTSCGCYREEHSRVHSVTHGMSYTTEFHIWSSMIARCENPNHEGYKNYGGRGIRVCDSWHKFAAFFKDMGKRPATLTLDRIDNDGNYEPGNCRWATRQQQVANRRPAKPTRRPLAA